MQSDRVDKSAKGWDESEKTELHPSQTDFKKGFGGKFGVETDKQDQVCAVNIQSIVELSMYPEPLLVHGQCCTISSASLV